MISPGRGTNSLPVELVSSYESGRPDLAFHYPSVRNWDSGRFRVAVNNGNYCVCGHGCSIYNATSFEV